MNVKECKEIMKKIPFFSSYLPVAAQEAMIKSIIQKGSLNISSKKSLHEHDYLTSLSQYVIAQMYKAYNTFKIIF